MMSSQIEFINSDLAQNTFLMYRIWTLFQQAWPVIIYDHFWMYNMAGESLGWKVCLPSVSAWPT